MVSRTLNCPTLTAFSFQGGCPISKCLYHSLQAPTHCITLGITAPDSSVSNGRSRNLTVSEIKLYKPELTQGLSEANLSRMRLNAIDSIKRLIRLDLYLEWLAETFGHELSVLEPKAYTNSDTYPFNIPSLGLTSSLVHLALDSRRYKLFKKSAAAKSSESEYTLGDIFELDSSELQSLKRRVAPKSDKSEPTTCSS